MSKEKTRYCSLDIETSGFDPLVNEVLEVGFAFFELDKEGIKITEEFSQVFKPAKEVPPAIFGLTGITKQELEEAPPFTEYRDVIQEKLGNAIIVGHNITFDTRFLEGFGMKFSGQMIDTLDLVQFILPTHHSYNLENLMHVFHVPHKEAHRALADAKATLVVLEKLLRVFSGYPAGLKKQVLSLVKSQNFAWENFLSVKLAPLSFNPPAKPQPAISPKEDLAIKPKGIYDFTLGENHLYRTVSALKSQSGKSLLALSKESTVMELWKAGLVEAVFSPEVTFDEKKFSAFLEKKEKTAEEIRFLLKVLVWQQTNWQRRCLLDLNLSFFGGQFRQAISGGESVEQTKAKLLCCSQASLYDFAQKGWYKARLAVIDGLAEFEQYLSSGLTTKVSWGYVAYLLRSFYNPELGTGNKKYKEAVLQMLERTDLFFGLAGALFQNDSGGFQYVKVTQDLTYSEKFQKIAKASEHFTAQLEEFSSLAGSKELKQAACDLQEFFTLRPSKVHWMELGEKRCAFYSAPLDVTALVNKVLSNFKKIAFVDSLGSGKILSYYCSRLGLKNFKKTDIAPAILLPTPLNNPGQGDLFLAPAPALESVQPAPTALAVRKPKTAIPALRPAKTIYHYLAKQVAGQDLVKLLKDAPLPAAVLFGTATQVKGFYDEFYQELQQVGHLLANTHNGGSNKLFHNFSINPDSILLATDKFILKFLGSTSSQEPVRHLPVKTLVLCHLPFEQFSHPYQEALTAQLANSFLDYSLPKAIYNLHRLLKFFHTPDLENVYLWDAKLAKPYASDFKDYLKGLGKGFVEE